MCCFSLKKSKNDWRISLAVMEFGDPLGVNREWASAALVSRAIDGGLSKCWRAEFQGFLSPLKQCRKILYDERGKSFEKPAG